MLCLSCGAQMSLTRCVRGRGKLCAPDSFSRSRSVTLRPPPTPRVESDADTLRHFWSPRPLYLCVSVPRLSSYSHTLVWRFHTLCARAASSCQHSDYMALLFRVSQRLSTMNRQVECNPTLEGLTWLSNSVGVIMNVIHHCGAPAPQPASRNVSSA